MEENSTNQSQSKKSSTGMAFGIIGAIAIVLLIGLWFVNRSSIDDLSRQLAQTQSQVMNVQKETQEAKSEVKDEMKEGVDQISGALDDINNPIVRLALTKAYVSKLQSTLDAKSKEDLNVILVYVQKNPTVLVKKPATWPADVQQAVTNLQTKLASARASVATSVADAQTATQAKVNDLLTLTGTLAFVSDDSTLGGSVFVMTTTEGGKKYYFEFNKTTSDQIKSSMLGKEVSIRVKVTGIEDGHVTYDVVSGPTLVSATPTAAPTQASASGTTNQ